MEIHRRTQSQTATVAKDAKDSEALEAKESVTGLFLTPTTFDGTVMNFKVSPTKGGTYTFAYSTASTKELTTCAANGWYPIPDNVMKAGYFKLSCATTQTTTSSVFTARMKS